MKEDISVSFFKIAGLTILQVSVFLVFYEAIVEMYVRYIGPMNKVFGFGMQMDYGIYLLTILATLNAIAQVFALQIRFRIAATALFTGVWILYWGNIADAVPNRFLMLSALGIMSLMVGVLFTFPEFEVRIELK
jgi:hypothetical protein